MLEGARAERVDATASGPLPDLHELRDDLPVRRALRTPRRHRPRRRRASACRGRSRNAGSARLLRCGITTALDLRSAPCASAGCAAPLLPARLRSKLPAARAPGAWPQRTHARKVLLLNGCVQPALMPAIDAATARVLDALGIEGDRRGAFGLLRRDRLSPDCDRSGAGSGAPQYRCVVAAHRAGRRSDRDQRLRLRRDGQGLRASAARRSRLRATRRGASSRSRAISPSFCARMQAGARSQVFKPGIRRRRCAASPSIRPARCSTRRRSAAPSKESSPRSAPNSCRSPTRICAAARPAPTRCCNPSCRSSCARASSRICSASNPPMILSANIGCLRASGRRGAEIPVRHWIEWVDGLLAR